jgi:hypothetical protein
MDSSFHWNDGHTNNVIPVKTEIQKTLLFCPTIIYFMLINMPLQCENAHEICGFHSNIQGVFICLVGLVPPNNAINMMGQVPSY